MKLPTPLSAPRTVSKAIGGAVASAAIGNGMLLQMPPEALAGMPWWGYLVYNAVFLAVGYGVPYFFPRNESR